MLDTNIVIYTMKNKPSHMRHVFKANYGQMCISSVSLMELYFGAGNSTKPARNFAEIEGFVARLDVLDYNAKAAMHTGQIRTELKRHGTSIGPYDAMIAGHARSQGLIVVTNNEREFRRVSGLRIQNWT